MKSNRKTLFGTLRPKRLRGQAVAAAALALSAGGLWAASPVSTNEPARLLRSLSIEELMDLKVTSVSKKEECLSQTAAAVTVITQDEIRRSGVTTIPDALRLAPGVDVGRVDAHEWAVGVRGLNDVFTPSLLTLIDGRSIYTPLFAGTFWQANDVLLENIDRIEVIRGPGSTVWGANAFNGVVNIVTKPASETQGLLVTGGGGSQLFGAAGAQYGGQAGDHTFYRVYGKFDNWDNSRLVPDGEANDQWWKAQSGFRLDFQPSTADHFTLQGDFYDLEAHQNMPRVSLSPPSKTSIAGRWKQFGGNLLGRWTRDFSAESDLAIQVYYDGSDLDLPTFRDVQNVFDLDLRHRFAWGNRQEIVWGGGYRLTHSAFDNSFEITLHDDRRLDQIGNAFVQDEIALVPKKLRLTLGTKLEYNNITGFEYQPGARLAWTPTDKQTVWASVTRAVRTPSAFENDGTIHLTVLPTLPPTLITFEGNSDFESEQLLAYELGYRIEPHPRVSVDATAFVNSYRGLRWGADTLDMSGLPAYVEVVQIAGNSINGETYGAELSIVWQATDRWRLAGVYSYLGNNLKVGTEKVSIAAPEHQMSIRSGIDITRDLDFDVWLRYVGGLGDSGATLPDNPWPASVPDYFACDVRLAWRPVKNLELAIVGQNLWDSPHREFNPSYYSTQATKVTRSVFAKVTWRF